MGLLALMLLIESLLRRLGRDKEAALAYEAAIALTENTAERSFLQQRPQALN